MYDVSTEASPCNHFYRGIAISITYYERVFVTLSIWHDIRMRHIVICGSSSCSTFFHVLS